MHHTRPSLRVASAVLHFLSLIEDPAIIFDRMGTNDDLNSWSPIGVGCRRNPFWRNRKPKSSRPWGCGRPLMGGMLNFVGNNPIA